MQIYVVGANFKVSTQVSWSSACHCQTTYSLPGMGIFRTSLGTLYCCSCTQLHKPLLKNEKIKYSNHYQAPILSFGQPRRTSVVKRLKKNLPTLTEWTGFLQLNTWQELMMIFQIGFQASNFGEFQHFHQPSHLYILSRSFLLAN